ncbi:MAG: PD-(D/E)XK nuclease family protein [Alphaproteobacteria bacterium]|nr:PD-(D/E)XK nuclease family protein [Alphaproteobacteria bacterium]
MRVIFGWHLDGTTLPETANGMPSCLGETVAGPATLLDILETELGLGGPPSSAVERIAAFQARLAVLDGPARFYSCSFATDPWATARQLLSWRDELISGGWDRKPVNNGGERLACLAEVEGLGQPPLPPGQADRLRAVVTAVTPPLDLRVIELEAPADTLPPLWRCLLQGLTDAGVAVSCRPAPVADEGAGDLACIQRLLDGGQPGSVSGDGSLVMLEADDPWKAADAVAAWLAAGQNDGIAVIVDSGGTLLDQACHDRGLPRPGADDASRWRSALQVLPLAFEARWAPFSPQRLLELLTLPQGPVPRLVASLFADALREEPGLGGPCWRRAWENAVPRRREALAKRPGLADVETKLAKDIETWRGWLEGACYDPAEGMPLVEALAICRRVKQWARARVETSGDGLLQAAAAQAAACERALQIAGGGNIGRVQLGRILDEVVAEGVAAGWAGAEAAPWTAVAHPGRLWQQARAVVWWGFMGPVAGSRPPVWSAPELAALTAAGVDIEPPADAVAREVMAWRRTVLRAGERLLLVRSRTQGGEATDSHPLWHEILGLLGRNQVAPLVVDAAALLADPAPLLAGRRLSRVAGPLCQPPMAKAVWPVTPGVVQARTEESATSLSQLFGCPFAWVLDYAAHLRDGPTISVLDDHRLIGTVAHGVVEALFRERADWIAAPAAARAGELFDAALPQRAATLLLPGRLLDRNDARDRVAQAVGVLVELMAQAGLSFEASERRFAGGLDGLPFNGTVDLLLCDAAGRRVILDMKWTNWPKYKRQELEDGRAIQLAAYAAIVPDCRPDAAGYFMLRDAALFFAAPQPFPRHHVAGPALAEVWRACGDTYRHRMGELAAGRIAVPDEDWCGQAGVLAPEPACKPCRFSVLCGRKGG